LSWPRSDLSGAVYEIWGKAGPAPGSAGQITASGFLLAVTPANAWRHAGLQSGETWTYGVRVIDAAGLPSPFSDLVTATL
jgi:hypothetical protein